MDLPASWNLRPRAVFAGLLVLVGVVLLPTLGYRFVYDDSWTLITNGFLRCPGDLWMLFSGEATARHVPDSFRPTLVVFDMLTYQLFGLSTWVHHGISIVLHTLVCALGVRFLGKLGAPDLLRAGFLLLFGMLAIHAEAIAVVSFREDLLAAALGLGALIVATHATHATTATASWRRLLGYGVAAGALMVLACGAKMSAAGLPVVWLLACASDPWGRAATVGPRRRSVYLAVFTLMVMGVVLALAHTYWITGSVVPYGGAVDLRLHANRVGQSAVLAASMPMQLAYLQQMLVPLGLSPEYVDTTGSWTDSATVLATAAWISIVGYGVWCIRRRPLWACVLLGFVVLALPTANFVPMPNMRAERLMYLPSLPVCLGLAAALLALGRRLATRLGPAWVVAPTCVMAVIQGSALMAACGSYRSNRQLWMVAEATAPGSARAQALVAESLLVALRSLPESEPAHANLLARIEAHCSNAERLDPTYELSHLCFARLAINRRDWATASRRLKQALAVSVDRHARIYATLAEVSLDHPGLAPTNLSQEAEDFLTRGLLLYPYAPELEVAAGKLYHLQGEHQRALTHLRKARRLAPERGAVALKQIEVLLDVGDLQRAREIWLSDRQVIVRANPALRSALGTRLERAERLFPSPASASILSPGVFTDEP